MRMLEKWLLMPMFNAWWIGIYPFFQLRKYPLAYNKLVKDPGTASGGIDYHLTPKIGEAKSVFYISTLGISFTDLESAGPENQVIPTKLVLLVTFQARNIHKMQYRVGSNTWVDMATGAIKDVVRERVAMHTYFELLRNKYHDCTPATVGKTPRGEIIDGVKDIVNNGNAHNPSLTTSVGVEVTEIRVLDVDLGSEIGAQRETLTAAMMAGTIADANGKAAVITATHKAAADLAEGQAKNQVLRDRLQAYTQNPAATAGLFADSVASIGTLALGDEAAKRLLVTVPATPPRPTPPPTPARP